MSHQPYPNSLRKHHRPTSTSPRRTLRDSRRTSPTSNRLPPSLAGRSKANQWVERCQSLQSAAMAVGGYCLCRRWRGDGTAERRGRGDGIGACWGRGASRESRCAGEGRGVAGTDLCIELGWDGDDGERRLHTIMQWTPVVVVAREQPWQSTPV
jgi:hypothetical protein